MLLTYNFIDKDPVVDQLRTAIADSEFKGNLKALAVVTGLSYTTINKLLYGGTRRPQNATCEAIFRACGIERMPVKSERVRTDFTSNVIPIRKRFIKGRRK